MTSLQAFIVVMGLTGQLLVARKDARGYLAWILGNIALAVIYYQTQQFALIALLAINTAIQTLTMVVWLRRERVTGMRSSQTTDAS